MSKPIIVVTDLDGTLLDHHSYSWEPACEALALIKAACVPLVLCSSKTATEMATLRQSLDIADPFIVENGAAVYLPGPDKNNPDDNPETVAFGLNRAEVLSLLATAREKSGAMYKGFSEMTMADVMAATGLADVEAVNALQREFTEPLLWQDTEQCREKFMGQLARLGLSAVQGGRFLTVSAGTDKGKAVTWLKKYYEDLLGVMPDVIALGDSENDVSMLEAADYPVLVKSPVKPFPEMNNDKVIRTEKFGPEGWNDAVIEIMKQ